MSTPPHLARTRRIIVSACLAACSRTTQGLIELTEWHILDIEENYFPNAIQRRELPARKIWRVESASNRLRSALPDAAKSGSQITISREAKSPVLRKCNPSAGLGIARRVRDCVYDIRGVPQHDGAAPIRLVALWSRFETAFITRALAARSLGAS